MPVKPTYPGVYIEEIPSGVRTITGVSTSVAAFVDSFKRGLLNEAVQIFSMADFESEFGGLATDSEASYGIQQFFQNGGSEAWVVRVGEGAVAADITLTDAPQGGGNDVLRITAGRQISGGSAENPGLWANNLHVEIDYDTTDPATLFNLTVSEIRTEGARRVTLRTETFRNLSTQDRLANSAIDVVNDSSKLVQLARDTAWTSTARPAPNGTRSGVLPTPVTIPSDGDTFTVDPGTGAITCTIRYNGAPAPTTYAELRPYIENAIRAAATPAVSNAVRPLLSGATVRLIGRTPTQCYHIASGRSSGYTPSTTLTFAGPVAISLGLNTTPNWQQYRLGDAGQGGTAGDDGDTVGATELLGNRGLKTGLYALEDVSLFNILCIPRAATSDMSDPDMLAVYSQAETYCEERRAFLLIDIKPSVTDLEAMQTWLLQNELLRHRNAAVYFPRTFIPDPLNQNRLRSVGASGTIAGLYARTDATRGVWKAPAGTDARLRNVQGLAYVLTDPQNGALNPLGVNCLRNFPVYSNVCWGARTLDGADVQASEWKYIPVRRFTLFLEESLYRGTKWVVFEPNDEPLWAQIRLNIGAFMHNLFRQGAFQGTTPRDAYFVKCDKETTTQTDIDLGIVNIVVGFAPLKPAEFVIIKIQQMAGQIQV